ncbi:MAG: hypothetical protein M3209_08340 [Acidobacteriota bacterium]|nr:hypothetical protein [Acidobacteriota bacterium]
MAQKKQEEHLPGVSDKEQRQYEHIKKSAEKSGRYGDALKKSPLELSENSMKKKVMTKASNSGFRN